MSERKREKEREREKGYSNKRYGERKI